MSRINTLSDADVALLREMVAEYKRRRGNPTQRPTQQHVPPQAPEIYIGRTGALGLPPLNDVFVGTGSVYDMPGGVLTAEGIYECDIYKIVVNNGVARLVSAGFRKQVYNLSNAVINPSVWFVAMRDKFGSWIAVDACCNDVPIDTEIGTGTSTQFATCSCPLTTFCATFPGTVLDAGTFACTSFDDLGGQGCSSLSSPGVQLTQSEPGVCYYEKSYAEGGLCANIDGIVVVTLQCSEGVWTLSIRIDNDFGSTYQVIYTATGWDGASSKVFSLFQDTSSIGCLFSSTALVTPGAC